MRGAADVLPGWRRRAPCARQQPPYPTRLLAKPPRPRRFSNSGARFALFDIKRDIPLESVSGTFSATAGPSSGECRFHPWPAEAFCWNLRVWVVPYHWYREYRRENYSWEGEDILVNKLMRDLFGIQKGFYVDIGARHPFVLSNTALLYSQGRRGINIDAMPGSMALFETHRPEDINLEIAIAPVPNVLCFS